MSYDNAAQILGVPLDELNRENIKKNYKIQAIKYHPDKSSSLSKEAQDANQLMFCKINNANELLCNIFEPAKLQALSQQDKKECAVALIESSEKIRLIVLKEIMKAPVTVRKDILAEISLQSRIKRDYKDKYSLIKGEIESLLVEKLAYKPASITLNYRNHARTAKAVGNINENYKNLRGDVLKTAILEGFRASLQGLSVEEVTSKIAEFKASDEFKILKKSQGITSAFFRLQTDSVIAFEKISKQAEAGTFTSEPRLEEGTAAVPSSN